MPKPDFWELTSAKKKEVLRSAWNEYVSGWNTEFRDNLRTQQEQAEWESNVNETSRAAYDVYSESVSPVQILNLFLRS